MYQVTTHNIIITADPVFLDDESNPQDHHYVWAYQIAIENQRATTIQLLTRYWCITNKLGSTQEVRGQGVIGKQPVIHPGETYHYTSGVPLTTPSGIMSGRYTFQDENGDLLETLIPTFSLDSPYETILLN